MRAGTSSGRATTSCSIVGADTLLGDAERFYTAIVDGRPLATEKAPGFRDYIKWIAAQDESSRSPTGRTPCRACVAARRPWATGERRPVERNGDHRRQLEGLRAMARGAGVTASMLCDRLGMTLTDLAAGRAWSSATVSAGYEVPNVEEIVGSFVNNVPVRVFSQTRRWAS